MGSFLINPFVSFPAAGGAWAPDDISGLWSWHDADSLSLNNDDPVGDSGTGKEWTDRGTNGYDMVQSTATNRPLFKTNVQNSKPGILFDGSNDWLETTTATLTQAFTVCVACKNTSVSGDRYIFDGSTARSLLRSSATSLQVFAGSLQNVPSYTHDTNAHYVIIVFNGSSSEVHIDGTTYTTSLNVGTNNLDDLVYGRRGDIGGSYYSGYIFEAFIYDSALGASDRGDVESYFADKWGI